jgi:hypothetical protein
VRNSLLKATRAEAWRGWFRFVGKRPPDIPVSRRTGTRHLLPLRWAERSVREAPAAASGRQRPGASRLEEGIVSRNLLDKSHLRTLLFRRPAFLVGTTYPVFSFFHFFHDLLDGMNLVAVIYEHQIVIVVHPAICGRHRPRTGTFGHCVPWPGRSGHACSPLPWRSTPHAPS